jgi:hypothetical protein
MRSLLFALLLAPAPETVLRASDFGLKGDGVTDDGPALQRAMEALRQAGPPATLRFETGRTYRIRTASATWVLELKGLRDATLDGGGSTFVLDAHLRFIHMNSCVNAAVRGFSLDFHPLPFADGTIVAVDPAARSVDVKIHEGFAVPPLGGPTREREQAYFAMLWHEGTHGPIGQHYFLKDTVEAYPGSLKDRIVRAVANPDFNGFGAIRENRTRISLPVRGVAHRMQGFGASPAVVVEENDGVRFEDVAVWSAPLFAVNVARNRGTCVFRRFDIRPKPGTTRLTSSWRDGFHVKANYASLLWEDCHLEGMNDDAFNTATHSSRVVEVLSPSSIRIRQNFPLGFVPFLEGDTLAAYDIAGGRRLGSAKVAGAEEESKVDPADPVRPAPALKVTLQRDLPGLRKGDLVWNESSANPDTVIRRCRIFNSCRFQSPVTVDDCDITAFCWFYGDNIEGPLPSRVTIRNSRLRQGRGNPQMVASFTSLIRGADGKPAPPRQPVIPGVVLKDNVIDGTLDLGFVENATLEGNRFLSPRGSLAIRESRSVTLHDNLLGDSPLERPDQIRIPDEATRRAVTFR